MPVPERSGPPRSPGRRPPAARRSRRPGPLAAPFALLALLAGGCGSATPSAGDAVPAATTAPPDTPPAATTAPPAAPPPAAPPPALGPEAFGAADAALDQRVASARLAGGVAIVVRDGNEVHHHAAGRIDRSTPLAVASTAKWLTAAALLTFVDEGALGLDDPLDRWLPELAAPAPQTSARHLLTHTSGIRDQPCLWSAGDRLGECVRRLAAAPRQFAPGSAFSYGNAGYHVIGRLVEVLGGADFATVVHHRLGEPLGLTATSWAGAPANPSPAAGLRTSADDLVRVLALVAARGTTGGRRLLAERSVDELLRNQIAGHDTAGDEAVGITGIPRYALGAWPDEVDGAGATVVVSPNGGRGCYPWIDLATGTYGVVAVQDDRGATVAVPASQAVARRYWQAARG